MPEKPSPSQRPHEFYIDAKWDKVIDTGLRRTVYGAAAGGLAALVLFRGSGARLASLTFGAGWGMGSTYSDSREELNAVLPKLQPPQPPQSDSQHQDH
ncbi:hypothetical protein WJX74_006663 [Apatococcus lobatus]|uniref:MICOS complex subunit MIC10 n=1 Tax=Apatococcus lobatus TaxID=904363 RepID=A0AAW1SGF5_9CHLO